ncbi:hypothetical protein IW261DRAFT_1068711 [Armillaria novae-zelandiae]|uniref:Uncharacterized protein n=1 Tax=Armillaria novae-zelandiae TaxID=153914 RepID=A0AA39PDF3_9AGAR|nr:hypothetical protein IW261DRAFT_1068711 [Armillaria novae-zelandiae]
MNNSKRVYYTPLYMAVAYINAGAWNIAYYCCEVATWISIGGTSLFNVANIDVRLVHPPERHSFIRILMATVEEASEEYYVPSDPSPRMTEPRACLWTTEGEALWNEVLTEDHIDVERGDDCHHSKGRAHRICVLVPEGHHLTRLWAQCGLLEPRCGILLSASTNKIFWWGFQVRNQTE